MPTIYNGQIEDPVAIGYYFGDETPVAGYAVCFANDFDDTATDKRKHFGAKLAKPATANLSFFAGIIKNVFEDTGGAWKIEYYPKASCKPVKAYTKVSCTAHTTTLGVTNAGGWNLVGHSDSELNMPFVGIAAETKNTSSTAALTKVFMK